MKLLLDECTPKRLKLDFPDHQVFTVDDLGLKGVKNGELLRAAAGEGFEVLITVDRKMPFQQNLANLQLAVLILIFFSALIRKTSQMARQNKSNPNFADRRSYQALIKL